MNPDDLVQELINCFGYEDLFSNSLIHRAAEEIVALRARVTDLQAEVARLERLVNW